MGMSREWKPGQIAMVAGPEGIRRAVRRGGVWINLDSEGYLIDAYVENVFPLVVIDPEDTKAVERLRHTIWTGGTLDQWQAALREFANPTPPRPEEPTDPAVRVLDREGDTWARIGEKWVNNQGGKSQPWDYIVEHYSPLEVRP